MSTQRAVVKSTAMDAAMLDYTISKSIVALSSGNDFKVCFDPFLVKACRKSRVF